MQNDTEGITFGYESESRIRFKHGEKVEEWQKRRVAYKGGAIWRVIASLTNWVRGWTTPEG